MIEVKDEILSGEPIYRLTQTTDIFGRVAYKIELVTPTTQTGTPLNKLLFDSIKTDIDSKLNISDKATQAQAEAGTNNTNYMTSLTTKQAITFNKFIYTPITLSSSQITTLNLSSYLTANDRVDIVVNATFGNNGISDNYKDLIIYGDAIRTDGFFGTSVNPGGVSSLTLCSKAEKSNFVISILPKQRSMSIKGVCKQYNQSSTALDYLCAFDSITSIKLGILEERATVGKNPDNPVAVIQYKN